MRISVITIVQHEDPRFADVAKTLLASLENCDGAELEWVVIDLVEDRAEEFADACGFLEGGYAFLAGGLSEARNLALEEASGDYIVMLDDCALVTASFVRVVAAAAQLELGLRFNWHTTTQWPIPENGLITDFENSEVVFVECSASAAAGIAFGAPADAFALIGGFDVAYDGGVGYSDTDACMRLGRAGVSFATSPRGWVIQQLSYSNEERTRSVANKKVLNALIKDRDRITPQDHQPEETLFGELDIAATIPLDKIDGAAERDDAPAPDEPAEEVSGDLDSGDEQDAAGDAGDSDEPVAAAAGDDGGWDLSDTPVDDVEPEPDKAA